tara:strand:- start:880 stop:1752 length:873 start_codon:yes stop_codon:yes gene_type:complete
MEKIGEEVDRGLTADEVRQIHKDLGLPQECLKELGDLCPASKACKHFTDDAVVLHIPNGVNVLLEEEAAAETLLTELAPLEVDKMALMGRGKGRKVKNKKARHNSLLYETTQMANFKQGQGTIHPIGALLHWARLRSAIVDRMPVLQSILTAPMVVEINKYYDTRGAIGKPTGIGWHGDEERKIVVGVRLGATEDMPMNWQWFYRHEQVGEKLVLPLQHGDVYIMSAKAVGTDRPKSARYTVRHATGLDHAKDKLSNEERAVKNAKKKAKKPKAKPKAKPKGAIRKRKAA